MTYPPPMLFTTYLSNQLIVIIVLRGSLSLSSVRLAHFSFFLVVVDPRPGSFHWVDVGVLLLLDVDYYGTGYPSMLSWNVFLL